MILELDRGNSRLKWRLLATGGRRLAGGALPAAEDSLQQLQNRLEPPITQIRLVNVAGPIILQAIVDWCRQVWKLSPAIATTTAEAGGVRCAYAAPQCLGSDRWLALLAARVHVGAQACIVADCGSALTVDGIDALGQHVGGYIGPGYRRIIESLLATTEEITPDRPLSPPSPGGICLRPANTTADALERGALLMLSGLADAAAAELRRATGAERPPLLLTGGDAPLLAASLAGSTLEGSLRPLPELVLDGLAPALGSASNRQPQH